MSDLVARIMGVTPTKQQRAAVTAALEPCLIVAGAGTGKTTVMSARIAWLVGQGLVRADRVLGLTFTTKAAGELASRVRRDLGTLAEATGLPEAMREAGEPTISTYNSFGARLLREHSIRIGIEPDARVVVDALRYQLAYRVVANTKVDLGAVGYEPRAAVEDLLALDQALANYLIEPEQVAAGERDRTSRFLAQQYGVDVHRSMVETSAKRAAILDVVIEFRAAKAAYDVLDYSDQIRLAAKVAEVSPAMRQAVREAFDVVLLDEYQDTSVSQKVLLQHLFGDGFPVMAVGDPLQSIYRWRGADLGNMLNFTRDFPACRDGVLVPCEQLSLSENWRSTQKVLDAANDISADLRLLHGAEPLTAGRTDLPPTSIEVALFPRFADEVTWIAGRLHELGQRVPWRDMAVLMRDKKNLASLVAELEALGIPVQLADPGALFALPEVREVICYLQVLADPTDNPALARILAGPRWMVGARDLAVLGEHAARLAGSQAGADDQPLEVQLEHIVAGRDVAERLSLLDALEQCDAAAGYSPEARQRMTALASELRALRRHVGEPLVDLVGRVVRTTGLGVESLARSMANGASRFDRLAMLYDLVSGFSDIDGRSGLDVFLSYVRDSDRYDAAVEAELPLTREAVTVMSMHKSKGLEYPVIALPGLSRGTFPSTVPDKYWPGNAFVLPPHYLPGVPPADLVRFPGEIADLDQDFQAHKAHVRSEREWDETRLAYVAVTRAAHHVLACGSWWGPTQRNKKGPSRYLEQIKAHATEVIAWEPEPTTTKNPFLTQLTHPEWPAAPEAQAVAQRQSQALRVQAHRGGTSSAHEPTTLTAAERALVAQWDVDALAVRAQLQRATASERVVRLPDTLTASQVMALRGDRQDFLAGLARPMPQRPSRAADRGTAFHAWVEVFYGSRGLFEPDSLPGAMDDAVYSDTELDRLKRAFETGRFAQRTPYAMESPFVLMVGGRPCLGRIDAVFRGTVDDPSATDRWLVIDWKTGQPGTADPVQLDIYRHAWAGVVQVPQEQVSAAFYYVGADQVEALREPRSLAELAQILAGAAS